MPDTVRQRAQKVEILLEQQKLPAQIVLEACESQIGGGGRFPLKKISTAVAIRSKYVSASRDGKRMRALATPIIGRMDKRCLGYGYADNREEKILTLSIVYKMC